MSTYVPNSYLRAEAAKNQITQEVAQLILQRDRALEQVKFVETSLQRMTQASPNGWAGLIGFVNNQAQNNPSDGQWTSLKGELDKIVADFQAERTKTTSILTAVSNVI